MKLPSLEKEKFWLQQDEATFDALSRIIPGHEQVFRIGEQYVLVDPAELSHVLLANSRNYRKGRGFRAMRLLMGNGLICQDGDFWMQQRRMIQPLFHRRVLMVMARTMRDHIIKLKHLWMEKAKTGTTFDLTLDVNKTILDTILSLIFSEDLPSIGEKPFEILLDASRQMDLVKPFQEQLNHVERIQKERKARGRMPDDLLSMLMLTTNHDGVPMPPVQVRHEVGTLIIAGQETTAAMIAWTWYMLGKHMDVERRLRSELQGVDYEHDEISSLPDLAYAQMVLFEVLRLFPPVWLEDRIAVAADDLCGFHVPAGTEIFLPIYFIHRDARFFHRPDEFFPERYEGYQLLERRYSSSEQPEADRRKSSRPTHSALLPFSIGPRRCIGDQFALMNAQLHFGIMTKHLRIRPVSEVVPEHKVNLRPRGGVLVKAELSP